MDPLVMLVLVPLAILLVFAVVLGWRHPSEGTDIVGRSISEEADPKARVKRREGRLRTRRRKKVRRRL